MKKSLGATLVEKLSWRQWQMLEQRTKAERSMVYRKGKEVEYLFVPGGVCWETKLETGSLRTDNRGPKLGESGFCAPGIYSRFFNQGVI